MPGFGRVRRVEDFFLWIQARFERGHGDDDLENGARMISAGRGAIDLRAQFRVIQSLPLVLAEPGNKVVRVKGGMGSDGDEIAVARVHDHHRAAGRAGIRDRRGAQRLFRRFLDG